MQVHERRDRLLLIAAFVVLAAIALGIAYWAWQQQARSIHRDADRNLVAVSRLKAEEITAWLAERRSDAKTVRDDRLLADGVAALLERNYTAQLRQDLRMRFASLAEHYHYEDIVLVRPDGSVVMREPSTASHDMGAVVEEKVREATRSGAVETSDLYRSKDGDVRLEMVAPVLDDAGRAIAAVVLHTDPGHRLFPLIQTWPIPEASPRSSSPRTTPTTWISRPRLSPRTTSPTGSSPRRTVWRRWRTCDARARSPGVRAATPP